jgi:hypothetical protein
MRHFISYFHFTSLAGLNLPNCDSWRPTSRHVAAPIQLVRRPIRSDATGRKLVVSSCRLRAAFGSTGWHDDHRLAV